MKVLLIAENWPPRVGGIENYLTNMAANLAPVQVTVVAPRVDSSPDKGRVGGVSKYATPHTTLVRGVNLIRRRFFWPLLKPAWLPLYLFLRRRVRQDKPDVMFCGKALFEGLVGLWLKQKFSIPYVVFTYAMEIEVWARQAAAKKKLQAVLAHADKVVYINEATKKSLLGLGVTEQQLVKIWPGVDDRFFQPIADTEKKRVRAKYNLPTTYILTVSRLIPRKGVDLLLDAFTPIYRYIDISIYGSIQLVIAGAGPEKQALQAKAQSLGIQDKVKFLGHIPDEDLPALYAGATVFALTPRRDSEDMEGFGIVYLEAAAAGVPAVGTLVGGVPEAVIHNQTGMLVQPDNPQAIAEALTLLLKDENKRKALGEAGKARAADQFRWSKRILLVKGTLDAVLS